LIPHLREANATAYVRASDDLDRVGGHHGHGLGQQVVGADAGILYPSGVVVYTAKRHRQCDLHRETPVIGYKGTLATHTILAPVFG
jgi:hypothetical protein